MVETATSTVRTATVADLFRMEDTAKQFYAASKYLRYFDFKKFRDVWASLLRNQGIILIYESEGQIKGALGGLLHTSLYGQELIAEEFFWFMRHDSRGAGVRLYAAFEEWAKKQGAACIHMVHLEDVMPDKVAHFYLSRGYEPIETRYEKRLT